MTRRVRWGAGILLAGFLVGARQAAGPVLGTIVATDARPAGTVVYLQPRAPAEPPAPRPSALIDQVNLRFVPQVLVVTPGTTVEFRNSDPILHNVFSPVSAGEGFDLGRYPRTERRSHTFSRPGAHVILCHVHPEMSAYVVVVPTPYYALAAEDGAFRINGVPPGRYVIQVWHPFFEAAEQELTVPVTGRLRVLLTSPRSRRGGAR